MIEQSKQVIQNIFKIQEMQYDTPKVEKGETIVLASHNNGKIKEFKTLLSKYNLNIVTAADIGIKDIEETGKTFEENSKIKAENVPNKYITISDDSGLCISCLSNKPGIFSARYAKKIQVAWLWLWKIYTKKL